MEAVCPKCQHNNALLREGDFIICRDCRYVHEPDELMLKKNILRQVKLLAREGTGIRTTEADDLYRRAVQGGKPSNLSWNDGSQSARMYYGVHPPSGLMKRLLTEMVASGHIKFVTEAPTERSRGHDYCWIVPADWADSPRQGFIHRAKINCEAFDLW